MTDRDIMQQALEALELLVNRPTEEALDYADNAITAIEKRLAQPEREPLTDEEIWDAYMEIPADFVCNMVDLVDFARAIEAAHGIKEKT